MLFSFHKSDLEPADDGTAMPRVLPYPLSSTAVYLGPDQMPEAWSEAIREAGVDPEVKRGRWVVEIRDERVPDAPVALCVVAFDNGKPVTEALQIMPTYRPMNLAQYLHSLGNRLWGICESCDTYPVD